MIAVLLTAALATGSDGIAAGVTLAVVRADILLRLALIVSTVIFLLVCWAPFFGEQQATYSAAGRSSPAVLA